MDIFLNIDDVDVRTRLEGENTTQDWKNHRVSKSSGGWKTIASADFATFDQLQLAADIAEVFSRCSGYFHAYGADCRHEGVYNQGRGTKIIALPIEKRHGKPDENCQKIEFFSNNIAELKVAMAALRDGLISPTRPITCPHGAQTYSDLKATVEAQERALKTLNEQAFTSVRVLIAAQQMITEQGAYIKQLKGALEAHIAS